MAQTSDSPSPSLKLKTARTLKWNTIDRVSSQVLYALVGIVLAISLLTIPQMTANLFTFSFKRIIWSSILIGWIDCLAGLAIAYWLNVPSGAAIIFFSVVFYALAKAIKSLSYQLFKRELA